MTTLYKLKRFKNLFIIDLLKIYLRLVILEGYLIVQVLMKDLFHLRLNGIVLFKIQNMILIKWTMKTPLIHSLFVNHSKRNGNKVFLFKILSEIHLHHFHSVVILKVHII